MIGHVRASGVCKDYFLARSGPVGYVKTIFWPGPGLSVDALWGNNQADVDPEVTEAMKLIHNVPEMLIVCCWRCIKEVSTLQGIDRGHIYK